MVARKNRFVAHVYLTVLLLVIVIFIIGMLLGRSMGRAKENDILKFIKNTELNTESYIIEQELTKDFDENSCELAKNRIIDLSNQLGFIGRKLVAEDAEKSLGKDEYNFLKRKYYLMETRTYFMFSKLMKNCNISENVILYYFSPGYTPEEDQGRILDSVVEDFNVRVFTIESNYSKELSFLESYYNITSTPTIIINYKTRKEGLTEYDEIVGLLGDS